MKNITKQVVVLLLLINFSLLAESGGSLEFGFIGGLSIPNENMSDFFNVENVNIEVDSLKSIGTFITNSAADKGYHLGVRLSTDITSNIYIYGAITFHRFNKGSYKLAVSNEELSDTVLASFQATTNIVPITVGINAYLMRKTIGIYLTGDLTYNFISTSVDYEVKKKITLPIYLDRTISRPGCGIGAGIDFDLSLFLLAVEAKYNLTNLVGREDGEPKKNYISVSLGVTF